MPDALDFEQPLYELENRGAIRDSLASLSDKTLDRLIADCYEKFRRIGVFEEESLLQQR